MLTDGATYDDAGIIRGFQDKAHRVPGRNIVITTRGDTAIGRLVIEHVQNTIEDSDTFDEAMQWIGVYLAQFKIMPNFDNHFEVLIAGISEAAGPIIHYGSTRLMGGQEPFVLRSTKIGVTCGAVFDQRIRQEVLARGGMVKFGTAMMEGIRHKAPVGKDAAQSFSVVGGHIDYTVVSSAGVITKRIHTWPDRIGEPVQRGNVVPMVAGMSRQQRRAAERRWRSCRIEKSINLMTMSGMMSSTR